MEGAWTTRHNSHVLRTMVRWQARRGTLSSVFTWFRHAHTIEGQDTEGVVEARTQFHLRGKGTGSHTHIHTPPLLTSFWLHISFILMCKQFLPKNIMLKLYTIIWSIRDEDTYRLLYIIHDLRGPP